MNYAAVDRGVDGAVKVEIPASWATAEDTEAAAARKTTEFVKNIVEPMNAQEGDKLPVSAFSGREDGHFPTGTAAYEKRGVAVNVPEWTLKTVSSVTSALMYVLTLQSDLFW